MSLQLNMRMIHSRCRECGECMLWTGSVHDDGYPIAWHDGKHVSVRRLVYKLVRGRAVERGMLCITTCGDRRCLSPEHVIQRTVSVHRKVLYDAGAYASPVGKKARIDGKRAVSKLNLELAEWVRESQQSHTETAIALNVSRQMIAKVRSGELWKRDPVRIVSSVFGMGDDPIKIDSWCEISEEKKRVRPPREAKQKPTEQKIATILRDGPMRNWGYHGIVERRAKDFE